MDVDCKQADNCGESPSGGNVRFGVPCGSGFFPLVVNKYLDQQA